MFACESTVYNDFWTTCSFNNFEITAFKFGFGETDYRRREGKGPLTVHLSRLGASENLTVTVRPVSYTWQNASEDIKEKMQMFSSKPSVAATRK